MDRFSPLSTPAATKLVLEAHGLTAKYSLGQNFLVNDDVLRKIIELSEVAPEDGVLEVGPGIGTLTIALLKHGRYVVAVERDEDLPAVLADTTAPWAHRFALIGKDALDLTVADVEEAVASLDAAARPQDDATAVFPHRLIANLPYAVAATVVLDYFQRFDAIGSATVMVQKEVADRMAARPGTKTYGAYTVKLGMYAKPAGRFSVGPGNFFPPPRVESAVIRLDRAMPQDEEGKPVTDKVRSAACLMADAAFASRRKTLANSCRTFFKGRKASGAAAIASLPQIFEQAAIDPSVRGETLDQAAFLRLGAAYLNCTA